MAYKRRNREFEERLAGLVRGKNYRESVIAKQKFWARARALRPPIPLAVHPTLWLIAGLVIGFVIGHSLRGF